ncbi:hypothetical protein CF319_g9250 [Tilletia indica]|nr:hypothetical protein CF319_g9250 [Tilletia indica]
MSHDMSLLTPSKPEEASSGIAGLRPSNASLDRSTPPDSASVGIRISGSAEYEHLVRKFTRAQSKPKTLELKTDKNMVLFKGKDTWMDWRSYLLGLLGPFVGGRLWYLMHNHPATSIDAYCVIFSENGVPIDREEAALNREDDIETLAGAILRTLDSSIHSRTTGATLNSSTVIAPGDLDGIEIYAKLFQKYSGADLGSLSAADLALSTFKLEGRTVTEVDEALQEIFNRIHISGREPLSERRKVENVTGVDQVRSERKGR